MSLTKKMSIFIIIFGFGIFIGRATSDFGYLYKKARVSNEFLEFLKPVACKEYKGLSCNATDFMKPYRVIIIQHSFELGMVQEGIKSGSIEDISSYYPLEIGDFIKYDFDNQKFIRISSKSPTHLQIKD